MQTYPFICEEGTYQAYGYFPLKDFPEEIYNCFCKGKLPTYDCTGNRTHHVAVLLLRNRYPGITRWNLAPGSRTEGLPLLTLDQLKELAFIDSLEN